MPDTVDLSIRLNDGRRLGYAEWGDPGGRPLLYFHGWPGSRLEGRLADEVASAQGIRLIALDRPGMGLSQYQPHRTLTGWPDDVSELADDLGLDRFAVLGISGGGPYAVVCASKLPDRCICTGVVSGLGPLDVPDATAGMGRQNRVAFGHVARVPAARRAIMARLSAATRRHPDRVLESGVAAAADKKYLQRPEVRATLSESLSEAFRAGGRGAAWEMGLYSRPWGFRLEDIRTPVHLWHGEQDGNAPISMGRYMAAAIPNCESTFYPGEGHLLFVDRLPQILTAVSPPQVTDGH